MKRTSSSICLALWTSAMSVAACTGYIADQVIPSNDEVAGDEGDDGERGGTKASRAVTTNKGGAGGKTTGSSGSGGQSTKGAGGDSEPADDDEDADDSSAGGATNRGGATSAGGAAGQKASSGGAAGSGSGTAKGGANSGGASGNKGGGGSGGIAGARGGATGGGGTTNRGGAPGAGGATVGAGGKPVAATFTPMQGGKEGWMSRYWDCCKPSCGWKANTGGRNPIQSCNQSNQKLGDNEAQSACNNGQAFMCWGFSPWSESATRSYGYVASNVDCGKCFQIQFTGGTHNSGDPDEGSISLAGKEMIVQVINKGGIAGDQFDLLLPGGGVGDFDACSRQWNNSQLGERYGGLFLACQKSSNFDYAASKTCLQQKCQSLFSGKPDLMAGCDWFLTWFGAPDNPKLQYKEVACPSQLTQRSGLQ